jgi:large subunit ribosomal protein L33
VRVAAPSAPAASPRSSSELTSDPARSRVGVGRSPPQRAKRANQMAKSDKRVKITLECTECKRRNYITMKSKINDRERLEMKKYCSNDRRHTVHKETR